MRQSRHRASSFVLAVAFIAAAFIVAPAAAGTDRAEAASGCVRLSLKIDPLVAHPGDRVNITTGAVNCGSQLLKLKIQTKITPPAPCRISTSNSRLMIKPGQLGHVKVQFKPKCLGRHLVHSSAQDEDSLELLGALEEAFDVV